MRFDAVKFVNHADDHPEDPVLRVRPLDVHELEALYAMLIRHLGLERKARPDDILRSLGTSLSRVRGTDANTERFDPLTVLPAHVAKVGEDAFLTLGEPDDVWRISRIDLRRYFDSVWYPGPDDLLIMDPEACWVIGVSSGGAVSCWLGNPDGG